MLEYLIGAMIVNSLYDHDDWDDWYDDDGWY